MSNPYSDGGSPSRNASSAPPQPAPSEVVLAEVMTISKDIAWQLQHMRLVATTEAKNTSEYRSAALCEAREMRASIDRLTASIEYLRSGLSVPTSEHGPVQSNRKW